MEWWSSGVMEFKATALRPACHYSNTPSPLPRLLESDRMPRGFHLDGIENPVRVFRVAAEVIQDGATDVELDVDGVAGLQFLAVIVVAAGIDTVIYITSDCAIHIEFHAI